MTEAIASQLQNILSANGDFTHWHHLESEWQDKIKGAIRGDYPPDYFISPHHVETLAEIVAYAYQQQLAMMPCGNANKLNWGGLVNPVELVLSTSNLNRLLEHAVGDLTVTVEAGMKLADLQHILHQVGQFLPLDPAYPESATIGGIVATADSGSWRQRYGGVRDMLLGISFVRSDGQIAKAGGKVVKNVAGYDLMKLLTGSYGTLGIITQVTLRVFPLPSASQTIVLTGEAKSIESLRQIIIKSALTPTAFDLVSASVVDYFGVGKGLGLIIRFQGITESVQQQARNIQNLAEQLGLQINSYQDENEANLWDKLQLLIPSSPTNSIIKCKIGVVPTTIINLLQELPPKTLALIHASSGIGKLVWENEVAINQIKKVRSLCEQSSGFLTILEANSIIKQQIEPWGYTGNAIEIMTKLKQKFDPQNLLNPHRFIGVI